MNEHENKGNDEGVDTCRFCNCLSKEHCCHDCSLRIRLTAYCGCAVTCGNTLSDTRSKTCDKADASADGAASEDECLTHGFRYVGVDEHKNKGYDQ